MLAVVAYTQDAFASKPWATESTYCFVARSNAATGSCVTVTLVKPAGVNDVPPNGILVVPKVIELLVNALLGMFVRVFVDPLMDVPANVVSVPPRDNELEPIVTELFVSELLPILVSVFVAPLIEALVYVPPVIVLPVNVNALGRLNVTTVPAWFDVISFAVPLTAVIAPRPPAVIVVFVTEVSCP